MELPLANAPDAGLWRVHPDPQRLPLPPRDDEVPPNRFDDPHGVFAMRYTGERFVPAYSNAWPDGALTRTQRNAGAR